MSACGPLATDAVPPAMSDAGEDRKYLTADRLLDLTDFVEKGGCCDAEISMIQSV